MFEWVGIYLSGNTYLKMFEQIQFLMLKYADLFLSKTGTIFFFWNWMILESGYIAIYIEDVLATVVFQFEQDFT